MMISISKVFQAVGNGLEAEHAGEMLSTRGKPDLLQNYVQQPKPQCYRSRQQIKLMWSPSA